MIACIFEARCWCFMIFLIWNGINMLLQTCSIISDFFYLGSWWPAFSVVWNTFQTATTQVKRATLPFLQVANILGWLCLSCRMSVSFLRNSLPGEKVIKIQVSPHLLFKLFMLKQIPPLAPNTAKNLSFACQTSSWCCLYVPKDCKHAGRIVRVD